MTSQTGQQIITIHMLLNISERKATRQWIWSVNKIEDKKNFSWEIILKCGGEASLRPFYSKSKLDISLGQQSEML